MKKLSPDDLRSRLRFDYQVCQRMFGPIFTGEAYRNATDMRLRRNRITSLSEADQARKYRIDFHVRTLIGKDQFSDLTTIGVDLEAGNYPFEEPPSWVISKPIPYSPHFKSGRGVCTGSLWETANGRMLLGELLVHIARMLNWDSTTHWTYKTDTIYEGWNPEAARYYYSRYGREPITKNLPYPLVHVNTDTTPGPKDAEPQASGDRVPLAHPQDSTQEVESERPVFRSRNLGQETRDHIPLFRPHKPDNAAPSKLFRHRED